MKLYEITNETQAILDDFDQRVIEGEFEDGVFPPAMQDALNELSQNQADKCLDLACVIKSKTANAKMLKEEAAKLTARAKTLENSAGWLKEYLGANLEEGKVLEDSRAKLSWRKSTTVEIDSSTWVGLSEFRLIKTTPNKTAMKEHLKEYGPADWGHLQENQKLQIK